MTYMINFKILRTVKISLTLMWTDSYLYYCSNCTPYNWYYMVPLLMELSLWTFQWLTYCFSLKQFALVQREFQIPVSKVKTPDYCQFNRLIPALVHLRSSLRPLLDWWYITMVPWYLLLPNSLQSDWQLRNGSGIEWESE